MLDYLKQKKADIEAKRVSVDDVYEDLDREAEQYRKELYTARNAEIKEHNKIIDAKVALLDEVIAEIEVSMKDKDEEAVSVEAVEEAVAEEVPIAKADETEVAEQDGDSVVIHYSKSV